jgi:AcrR family transcriptional regulator
MQPTAAASEPRPLRRDAERNRRRILDAAATVFAERGLDVSLDDIARHAEVGVGTIYRRFPNKDLLIDALFEDHVDGIVAVAEAALEIEDGWDGLEHFLRVALERQAENRGLKELLFGARMSGDSDHATSGRERIAPLVEQIVARAHAGGRLRDDVAVNDMPLIQMMVGAVVDYTRHADPDVWRRFYVLVLDGLRAPDGHRTPMPTGPLDADGVSCAMSSLRPRRS